MLRSLMTVSGFTLVSRVLGMVRDILMAGILGTTAVSDAFLTAFRFPNLFRRIFGEGAFNAAFVPQFAGALEAEGRREAEAFANQALSWMLLTLGLGTVLALPLMRWVMAGFAPGFLQPEGWEFSWQWLGEMLRYPHGTEKFELTVAWARIMFSYLLCMALVAQLSGMMNTFGRFGIPAFAPVLLNLVLIGGLTWAGWSQAGPAGAGLWLSWGVCVSGFLQLALLVWGVRRLGLGIKLVRPRFSARIARLFRKMGPGVLSAGVQQVNIMIGTQIASVQAMAVSYLYFAERIFQFPLGMIGVAFGVVLLPEISRSLKGGRASEAQQTIRDGLEFSMLLTLPATVAMLVIPVEILNALFGWGPAEFDVEQTARALMGFALGVPAYVLVKVLQPGYFAREDTKTPMFMAGVTVLTNIVCSLALFPWLGHVGIALATSIAGWVNVILLARGLRGFLELRVRNWVILVRMLFASLLMGGGLWLAARVLQGWMARGVWQEWLALALLVGFGMVLYALLALRLRVTSVTELRAALRRKPSSISQAREDQQDV